MRTNKIVLAISGVAALCLVCAVLLSAGEVGAELTVDTVGRQPARGLSYVPPAIPVLGGCGGFISYDQPVRGTIEPGRELCFEFGGSAGEVITARMTRIDGNLDPFLKLWSTNGLLTSDDDSGGGSDSLIASFMLPEGGGYALLAGGFDASTSGGFELLLTRATARPMPTPTGTPPAPPTCGGQIDYGNEVTGQLSPGARCLYQFVGKAGDSVTIALAGLDEQLDPWLDLLDPEGNVEASDDDGGGNSNSLIGDHRLLRSGEYTIVARAYQDGSAGFFRLSLHESWPPVVVIPPPKPPPPSCGGTLAYDRQAAGIINSGALTCTYAFSGRQGDLVTLRMDKTSGNLDPVIELLAPSNSRQVVVSNDDAYGNNSIIWRYRLTEGGQYQIRAHSYRNTSTGGFKLLLKQGLFRPGDRVQIIYAGSVNIRRSPGSIKKPEGDVLAVVPAGTVMTVEAGPVDADNLCWWQVKYQVSPDRDITGWMAEKRAAGQILLAPAFQP